MMTNLAHWQDDIDVALGGDFDGSLSGLCIMSLSFDFTRNGLSGSQLGQAKDNNASGSRITNHSATNRSHQVHHQQLAISVPPATSSTEASNRQSLSAGDGTVDEMNQEIQNDNSQAASFRRFKSSLARATGSGYRERANNSTNNDGDNDDDNKEDKSKLASIIKNCLSSTNTLATSKGNTKNSNNQGENDSFSTGRHFIGATNELNNQTRANSPEAPTEVDSPYRESSISTPDDSSRHSTNDVRSPSASSCISNQSHTSSNRSSQASPSDMSIHCPADNNHINSSNVNQSSTIRSNGGVTKDNRTGFTNADKNQTEHPQKPSENNQQISLYSVKDGLLNNGTLKESSYTTSVITTTAPMHFKSIHHPFSLKQFPPSPYHQFSNSSFNHDFYDRYLSHDSHQPLQTPLIGIERTQDLLSLKMPPHGPDDNDSHRFTKDWLFGGDQNNKGENIEHPSNDPASKLAETKTGINTAHANDLTIHNQQSAVGLKRKSRVPNNDNDGNDDQDEDDDDHRKRHKNFSFSYKGNSNGGTESHSNNGKAGGNRNEPIDLNLSYRNRNGCCDHNDSDDDKASDNMFDQSMKHFNPERMQHNYCHQNQTENNGSGGNNGSSSNNNSINRSRDNNHSGSIENDHTNVDHQYHPQESMFGLDQASKQKFQYVLSAPISIATKLSEDTMTYLNQAQAYEIKLENVADISEVKKGFMCSIINIGFHERHMQQAENELWQQWSQQHPNERIFSVDMKLSYNVFGVESDGLNKYEFLWDSSKAAGVFIRINSISTEFTLKKHGGEKGVPFKLSIETFSYNSKTHDSYFISAACCQIKVFKPKGAERKIRSDRDKVFKKPPSEQEKYHRSCDHTMFRECSLNSLHPMATDALCYYRHSHGHFASKQGALSVGGTPAIPQGPHTQSTSQQGRLSSNDMELTSNKSPNSDNNINQTTEKNQTVGDSPSQVSQPNNTDTEHSAHGPNSSRYSDYRANEHPRNSTNLTGMTSGTRTHTDYSTSRLIQDNNPYCRASMDNVDHHNEQHQSHQHQQQEDQHQSNNNNNNSSANFGASYSSHFSQFNSIDMNFANNSSSSNNNNGHHSGDSAQPSAINQMYHTDQIRNSLTGINNSHQFNMAYHNYTIPPTPSHQTIQHPHASSSATADYLSSLPTSYSNTLPSGNLHTQHFNHGLANPIYRQQLNHHERPTPSARFGQQHHSGPTSFRASNLAISSQSSSHTSFNLQPHEGASEEQDKKHSTLVSNSNNHSHYQHDNSFRTQVASNQNIQNPTNQLSGRQRSASTSSANPTNAHCSNYISGTANMTNHYVARQMDSYNPPIEQHSTAENNWANGTQSSDSSSCKTRACTGGNQSHDGGPFGHLGSQSSSDNNLSSVNLQHQYDSDQNSPHKSHTTNDSPVHCYSRFRGFNPTMSGSTNDQYDVKSSPTSYHLHTINVNSTCTQVATWLISNRFGSFSKTFNNFSGSDLLRLSKNELIDICGLLDGIRLFNSLHNQPIKPRRVLYICAENSEVFHPVYLYDVTLSELLKEITAIARSTSMQIISDNNLLGIDDKMRKLQTVDRSNLTSTSSADSRSSLGAISSDNGPEDVFGGNCRSSGTQEINHQRGFQMLWQSPSNANQSSNDMRSESIPYNSVISRLLIEGLTTVKIVATEQVIQMLEDESVWTLSFTRGSPSSSSDLIEACISAYRLRDSK